jgi:pyruvate,orthophosphate dikinase
MGSLLNLRYVLLYATDPRVLLIKVTFCLQRVYTFIKGNSDGGKDMKALLGGKGANLCEMAKLGLNVPPGFTISTEVCEQFQIAGGKLPDGAWEDILASLAEVEAAHGCKFGDPNDPLLLSVRSGAAISMPGMMDTVLNLGLNDEILKGFADKHGERFALDCYRRLLDMFGDVVLGIDHAAFEKEISAVKSAKGYNFDIEMQVEDLRDVVQRYKNVYTAVGQSLPEDPMVQLQMSIDAVFKSWNTPRAVKYREINKVTGLKGTAVNVQSMVYGNRNDDCGTGVCFTRNPATGEPGLYGEFLVNAQGEDVVAGIRTPLPVAQMAQAFPQAYDDLVKCTTALENHMHDMQDCEFTIQDKVLFMLQTRNGKRTGAAALQIAVDLEKEGLVTKAEAVLMVEPRHLDQLLHPMFANANGAEYKAAVIASGLAASPGAGCGRLVFTAEDAEAWKKNGEDVILVRTETSPEDVGGMHAAQAILTSRGGISSHAAVVARGWGRPAVVGCASLEVDEDAKTANFKGVVLNEGDWVCINGTTGEILKGKQPTKAPELAGNMAVFMSWVDQHRRLRVQTNCDTPADACIARKNGAEGIGLVRTEHMFFSSPERIAAVRNMIACEELEMSAIEALATLQKFQRADFLGIFEAMDGLPVTIRLLDPPLHEFIPHEGQALDQLCEQLVKQYHMKSGKHFNAHKILKSKLENLGEVNPMMGLRGCRLGIVHPDITKMQALAILEAAVDATQKGVKVSPHIMVPLVGFEEELANQAAVVHQAAQEVFAATGVTVPYKVGTMIEVPRVSYIFLIVSKRPSKTV